MQSLSVTLMGSVLIRKGIIMKEESEKNLVDNESEEWKTKLEISKLLTKLIPYNQVNITLTSDEDGDSIEET